MSTRYPILLIHGIMLKDFLSFQAFGAIEQILRNEGYTVFVSQIDGFGTSRTNSVQLRYEILDILAKTGAEKINLIAHSKGGLDSIAMIHTYHMEDQIASLTTLCTPHKGSPIATNILRLPKWMLAIVDFYLNTCYRIFGDKMPNAYEVCRQLALSDDIPLETMKLSEKIYCQSYSTTLEKSRDDFIMGIPLKFSHYFEKKKSDGLVSVESSRFGFYRGSCTEDSISHSEIVDFMTKRGKKAKIYRFYTDLCQNLAEKGF